jgi:hypothetical protein
VVERVAKVEMTFYSSGGWESGGPRRMAGGGGAESILQFWLERGGDRMKMKMKWRQRTHLDSIGRKCDMARWSDDISWMRGDTREGKERRRCQLA